MNKVNRIYNQNADVRLNCRYPHFILVLEEARFLSPKMWTFRVICNLMHS